MQYHIWREISFFLSNFLLIHTIPAFGAEAIGTTVCQPGFQGTRVCEGCRVWTLHRHRRQRLGICWTRWDHWRHPCCFRPPCGRHQYLVGKTRHSAMDASLTYQKVICARSILREFGQILLKPSPHLGRASALFSTEQSKRGSCFETDISVHLQSQRQKFLL